MDLFIEERINNLNGNGKIKAKVEALQKHLVEQKNKKVFGGIVIEKMENGL